MAKFPGSLWVEGTELHYVDQFNREWYYQGTHKAYFGAIPGSLWLDPTLGICFQSEAGNQTLSVPQAIVKLIPLASLQGSIWVENTTNWLNFAAAFNGVNNCIVALHTDVAFVGTHSDTHLDGGHVDSAHTDTAHTDVPANPSHSDSHTDVPHTDFAFSWHDDSHGDVEGLIFNDHFDTYQSGHYDNSHNDGGGNYTGHIDSYSVTGGNHLDGWTSNPSGLPSHYDNTGHIDIPHEDHHYDAHNDQPHQDSPHVDGHSDSTSGSPHNDIPHVDTPHLDAAHGDSHVDTHGDVAHQDQPILIGP